MMTPFKWLFAGLLVLILVVSIAYSSSTQNITTNTTSEVELLAESVSAGIIRSEIDAGDNFAFIDKKELEANLIAQVANVQKKHGQNIKIQYAFLDKDNRITTVDDKIRGVQFQVQLLGKDGESKGMAERRVSLNYNVQ